MKKRWLIALALLLCLCLFTACQGGKNTQYQVNNQGASGAQTGNAGSQTGNAGSQGGVLVGDEYMDPLAEEDYNNYDDSSWMEELPVPEPATPTRARGRRRNGTRRAPRRRRWRRRRNAGPRSPRSPPCSI